MRASSPGAGFSSGSAASSSDAACAAGAQPSNHLGKAGGARPRGLKSNPCRAASVSKVLNASSALQRLRGSGSSMRWSNAASSGTISESCWWRRLCSMRKLVWRNSRTSAGSASSSSVSGIMPVIIWKRSMPHDQTSCLALALSHASGAVKYGCPGRVAPFATGSPGTVHMCWKSQMTALQLSGSRRMSPTMRMFDGSKSRCAFPSRASSATARKTSAKSRRRVPNVTCSMDLVITRSRKLPWASSITMYTSSPRTAFSAVEA
mmetsp:Transcript_62487/g.181178  ORF Transcript_62487/g.181178 Transcript_62487/m.181178 type:complete len:263 (-) Transcript_62487:394-1182(-)